MVKLPTNSDKVILVLGSYDQETKTILYTVKESLSKTFLNLKENLFVFILDNTEVYLADVIDRQNEKKKIHLIVEKYDKENKRLAIITADAKYRFVDADDIKLVKDVEHSVNDYLTSHYFEFNFSRLAILDELKILAKGSSLTFVIRNQELTKGGEYIELVYLIAANFLQPQDIYLLKKECFTLSSMAWELLDYFKVQYRSYTKESELQRETIRIFQNYIRENNEE